MNYQIPESLKPFYPKVPYHNLAHTESFDWESCPSQEAYWAAVFHDFVYDPKVKGLEGNEFLSCRAYEKHVTFNHKSYFDLINHVQVKKLIMSTMDHVKYFDPDDQDMVWLHTNDLACFRDGEENVYENELNIFKEYQFTKFVFYRERRLELLNYYRKHPLVSQAKMDEVINYLSNWKPSYGLFVGSFNPFTCGHFDILQQAEKVFDKVIIAQGQNEEKETNIYSLHNVKALEYHELDSYEGSLFSYLDRKKKELGNITLIRGLRNYHDLHDESNLFNFAKDYTDVPFTYFISKSENLHISSGAVRKLLSLGKDVKDYLP